MKRMTILLVMALVLFAGNAFAADTATVTVNAEVMASCTFDTGVLTLDFGNLDPAVAGAAANASGALDFTCAAGTTYSMSAPAADVLTDGTNNINYSITLSGDVSGTSAGGAQSLTVDADIASGGFFGLPAGSYADTFTVDLTL